MTGRKERARGRPPKFSEPSRVVTLTLPESTLAQLDALDRDRARAIVRAAGFATGEAQPARPPAVEVLDGGKGTGILTVPSTRALSGIPGVHLLRINPGRHLLVLDPGTPLAEMEIAIIDKTDNPDLPAEDRSMLLDLLTELRRFRRNSGTRAGEVILLQLNAAEPAPADLH